MSRYEDNQTANSPRLAILNARVGDYVRTINLVLLNNYATGLKITPSVPSLKPDPTAEMTFTVNLNGKGAVSPGQQVTLTVRDAGDIDRGSYRIKKNVSDSSGNCSFTYNIMPNTAYRGKLTVRAQATANNQSLTDTITIYIIK